MEYSVIATPPSIIIAFTLFILILVVYWIAIKISGNKKNNEHGTEELGAVEGSLLGLLALLLAFTFNMAVTRFDMRRQVLIEEANNIGTAILRADLYPDSVRNLFRADFKDYVEARIAYYDAKTNQEKIKTALDQANTISTKL